MLTDFSLPLDAHAILRAQGLDPASLAGLPAGRARRLLAVAERAQRAGLPLLAPRAVSHSWDVHGVHHHRLCLSGGHSLDSPLLARRLASARQVTAVICTIGEALETCVTQALPGEPALALALDALGTAAIEALASQICRRLGEQAPPGWQTSLPLSPGLDGWDTLTGQRQLFSLLDPAPIGVRLLPSGMMIPRKSASFVIGFGPDLPTNGQPCDFCSLRQTCHYRLSHASAHVSD